MPRTMPTHSAAAPRLADAFLALGDTGQPVARGPRSPAVVAAAMATMAVLALSAPLAWATASPRHRDQPAATQASKAAVPAPDDDGADGGG
jgi:hypothetical protein